MSSNFADSQYKVTMTTTPENSPAHDYLQEKKISELFQVWRTELQSYQYRHT